MAKGTDYWRERAEQTSDRAYADEQATMDKISRAYKAGTQNITESVESIIYNYAKRYKMTEAEAKAAISAPISYEEYLALLPQIRALPAFGEEYMRLAQRAATRAANFRITRLESLQDNMRAQLSRVAAAQETATTDYLKNVFGISADEAAQEMWERLGMSGARLDSQTLTRILAEPWSGKNYSARIWDNAAQLQSTLESVMTSGLLNGDSVDDMARRIAEEMGVGLANARRLVRTEATYVHNQTTLESYRRAGLTQYEYMTAKDERVCDVCGPLDGQRFNIDEAYPGVNCPPMHPNCRCTTLAVLGEAARAETETSSTIWSDITRQVVESIEDTALNETSRGGIMSKVAKIGGDGVNFVGRLDPAKIAAIWQGVRVTVVLPDERIDHIMEGHADDYIQYGSYIADVVQDPDYILLDKDHPNTALYIGKVPGSNISVVIKLALQTDAADLLSSVITMYRLGEKRKKTMLKNNPMIYKRE
ncbi:hypothetical protein AGMMS49992_32320 [Clostridia bacterium]|nr:hypothetical protein AGMMS49992_32320 [Clostridia bacterium]